MAKLQIVLGIDAEKRRTADEHDFLHETLPHQIAVIAPMRSQQPALCQCLQKSVTRVGYIVRIDRVEDHPLTHSRFGLGHKLIRNP